METGQNEGALLERITHASFKKQETCDYNGDIGKARALLNLWRESCEKRGCACDYYDVKEALEDAFNEKLDQIVSKYGRFFASIAEPGIPAETFSKGTLKLMLAGVIACEDDFLRV
jgi:hypothetical protein